MNIQLNDKIEFTALSLTMFLSDFAVYLSEMDELSADALVESRDYVVRKIQAEKGGG